MVRMEDAVNDDVDELLDMRGLSTLGGRCKLNYREDARLKKGGLCLPTRQVRPGYVSMSDLLL